MKTVAERRLLVDPTHELSITKQCELMRLGRSSLYYENKGESAQNLEIMRLMDEHYHYHPWKGVPMMHAWLTLDQGYKISRNRVERLYYRVMGLRAIIPGPHTSKRHKNHPVYPYLLRGLAISSPMQVWATDITYIPLPKGFMYLTAVIDLYSRYVLNWSVSNTMEAQWCREMIAQAIEQYGKPQIINTDQGSQYTSTEFSKFILDAGIKLSMDGKGRATDNAFIERLWRTVKYENIRFKEYTNGVNLAKGLKLFFEDYNHKRRHSSIDYRFPVELFKRAA
ncbi:MAG: IS3 family transposase [Cyanobacteria bacterium P01_F01_bin.116]